MMCITSSLMYSQDISISFSYDEGMSCDDDPFSPYLIITYSNNSEKDYYLPSLFFPESKVPQLLDGGWQLVDGVWYGAEGKEKDAANIAACLYKFYSGQKYSWPKQFTSSKTREVDMLFPETHSGDCINDYLAGYYRLLSPDEVAKLPDSHDRYTQEDVKCDRILQNPAFIFLHAGERKTQRITLRGFKEAGIIVTLSLDNSTPPTSIETTFESYIPLPEKVQNFLLYKGYVLSQDITFDFSR